jgi:hypothetical protein
MNLREHAGMERAARINRLVSVRQPIDRVPGPWLACYPIFQEALRSGETTLGTLPDYAKSVVLRRTSIDLADQAIASATLNEIHVSFIELSTHFVSEAVKHYLGSEDDEANYSRTGLVTSTSLADRNTHVIYPLIARPPCLLHPGRHVFSNSWMRFFAYQSRGDLTIPLLAVDWLDFHHRLFKI